MFTDGAARGNPGPSASGFVVFEGGKAVRRHVFYNGTATNNVAEYKAIIAVLKWCLDFMSSPASTALMINSDSELVIRQLNGRYKTKSAAMRTLNREALELVGTFGLVVFESVKRSNKHVSEVDRELNRLLDGIEKKEQKGMRNA